MPPASEQRALEWRALSDTCHVGSDEGRVVAILYTVEAGDAEGRTWLEVCCLLADTPHQEVDVMFGVEEGAGDAWDLRWERGRAACELAYGWHLGDT